MSDESSTPAWYATPDEVIAVASQAAVFGEGDTPAGTNPEFDRHRSNQEVKGLPGSITHDRVSSWIKSVAGWVSVALSRRRKLPLEVRTEFESAMKAAVEVGAAAYLVDAAYPQRAGNNDLASYGDVLWTRYRQLLADLKASLDDLVDEAAEDDAGVRIRPGGSFPPAIFGDQWVRENADVIPAEPWPGRAPGTETPGGYY